MPTSRAARTTPPLPEGPWLLPPGHPVAGERWERVHPDGRVAWIASRQHGAVDLTQCVVAGLSESGVSRRVARGTLHRKAPGVLLVGHPEPTPDGRRMIEVLAGGDGAVLSHRTAAVMLALLPPDAEDDVEVCVPSGAGRKRTGVVAHRSAVDPQDVVVVRRMPVSGPHRCLLDLGDSGRRRLVADAFNEAQVLRIVRPAALRELLDRSPGRRGARILNDLIEAGEAPVVSRSELERRFRALCRAAGLPQPRFEVAFGEFRMDFFWPAHRICVEVDGLRYHETDRAKARDRRKDRALMLDGIVVLRYGWNDVTRRELLVAAELAGALAAAGSRAR